jgi:hypothetical protein
MATPVKPQKKLAYGKRRFWLVDTIASATAPTDDEINAGDYLACYPLSDAAGPVSTPNKVTLPVLLCETDTEEDFGTTTHTHPDLVLVYDPQAAAASAGKKAWDLVKDGYEGFIVWELGVDGDADDQIVAGEFVTVVPCKIRVISEEPTSTGEDGLLAFQVTVVVRSPYTKRNVAVVAAP